MEWGLSTHLFIYQPLDENLLGLIRSLGITRMELWGMRPQFDYEQPGRVRQLAQAAASQGIAIYSVHAPFYSHVSELAQGRTFSLAALNTREREEALAHTEKVLDIMDILGAKLLVAHAGDRIHREDVAAHLRHAAPGHLRTHLQYVPHLVAEPPTWVT